MGVFLSTRLSFGWTRKIPIAHSSYSLIIFLIKSPDYKIPWSGGGANGERSEFTVGNSLFQRERRQTISP